MKGQLIRKDPDAEKDWRQEEKGMTEDKMIWWHHRLSVYEFEQFQEMAKNREAWTTSVHGSQRDKIEWLNNINERLKQ